MDWEIQLRRYKRAEKRVRKYQGELEKEFQETLSTDTKDFLWNELRVSFTEMKKEAELYREKATQEGALSVEQDDGIEDNLEQIEDFLITAKRRLAKIIIQENANKIVEQDEVSDVVIGESVVSEGAGQASANDSASNIGASANDSASNIGSDLTASEIGSALQTLTILMQGQKDLNEKFVEEMSKPQQKRTSNEQFKLDRITPDKWSGNIIEYYDWKSAFIETLDASSTNNPAVRKAYLLKSVPSKYHEELKGSATLETGLEKIERYITKRRVYKEIVGQFKVLKRVEAKNKEQLTRMATEAEKHQERLKKVGETGEASGIKLVEEILDDKLPEDLSLSYRVICAELGKEMTLSHLVNYMRTVADSYQKSTKKPTNERSAKTCSLNNQTSDTNCACDKHCNYLMRCDIFKEMSVANRRKFVAESHRCFNCLGTTHRASECRSNGRCSTCKRKHHTFLHEESPKMSTSTVTQEDNKKQESKTATTATINNQANAVKKETTRLPVLVAQVQDQAGEWRDVRCLLDSGSDTTLVRSALASELGLRGDNTKIQYEVVGGGKRSEHTKLYSLNLRNKNKKFKCEVDAYGIGKPCGAAVGISEGFFQKNPHLMGIRQKVDVRGGKIDMLIGMDSEGGYLLHCLDSLVGEDCKMPRGNLYPLGWTVTGEVDCDGKTSGSSSGVKRIFSVEVMEDQPEEDIRKMLLSDQIGIKPTKLCVCSEKEIEEANFIINAKATTRIEDSKVVTKLPWKDGYPDALPNNRVAAEKALQRLEKRLRAQGKLEEYDKAIEELVKNEFVVEVEHQEGEKAFYLETHAVIREDHSSTPLRVVHNAAMEVSKGLTYNDCFEKGPDLTNKLFSVLLKWRENNIAIHGDISKMFNRVFVEKEDQPFQRILWRGLNPAGKIKTLQWTRVLFGDKPSPDIATNALRFVMKDCITEGSQAKDTIESSTYVDDIAASFADEESAQEVIKEIDETLQKGGFNIKAWHSNSPAIDELCSEEDKRKIIILGHRWDKDNDNVSLKVKNWPLINKDITKRNILRVIAKVWDPLGIVAAATLEAKIELQRLWERGVKWDEILPESERDEWVERLERLKDVEGVWIPRCIMPDARIEEAELHVFSDGSLDAYGAVAFLRWKQEDGSVAVNFVAAKALVTPLRIRSIPRIELVGIVIMARLVSTILASLSKPPRQVTCWTDSMTALQWIKSSSTKYKAFVQSRVAEIQETISPQWLRYIPGGINPADALTKPISVEQLHEWHKGPDFLHEPELNVPLGSDVVTALSEDEREGESKDVEIRKIKQGKKKKRKHIHHMADLSLTEEDPERQQVLDIIKEESTWRNILIILKDKFNLVEDSEVIVKIAKALQWGVNFSDNMYRKYSPEFDDKDGVFRMCGRLKSVKWLPKEVVAPIIFPKSVLNEKLARHYHLQEGHGGKHRAMVALEKNGMIPVGISRTLKEIKHRCIDCRISNRPLLQQRMGEIPDMRLMYEDCPFQATAADCFGPFKVKLSRNRSTEAHVVIFTCLTVRAVHLEFLYDQVDGKAGLTTEKLLLAFRRFVSLRGVRAGTMYTDGGSNFVGAEPLWQEIVKDWQEITKREEFKHTDLDWQWNPPTASHMNGAVESLIHSVRKALHSTCDCHGKSFTPDEWVTFLAEAMYMVNSRPLFPKDSSNPIEEASFISPNSILYGHHIVVDQPLPKDCINPRNRMHVVQEKAQIFWNLWIQYMPPQLNRRNKWFHTRSNIEVGDYVVIKKSGIEGCAPRAIWEIGIIIEVYPGRDGMVRKVKVKTKKHQLIRPIHKLVLIATAAELKEDVTLSEDLKHHIDKD